MATVMDLFDKEKKDIYGTNGYTFIESRGLVNIPRLKALALESPGGLIGAAAATVGKLIGGGAVGRPTDTIFRSNKNSSRALSLTAPTDTLLQEAVKPGESYYVKTNPSPALLGSFNSLKSKTNLKNGQAQSAAISALNKYGSKTGVENFMNSLKRKTPNDTTYGSKYMPDDKGNINDADYLYSTHYIDKDGQMKPRENAIKKMIESDIHGKHEDKDAMYNSTWESQTDELIATTVYDSENIDTKTIKNFIKDTQPKINIPYVLFKVYGDTKDENRSILLPATITNLSEQFTPAINSFKYIGSPFNLYRYAGIERVLSFDMKLYYTDGVTKQSMIKKLNLLREYTFPDRNLTTITYPGSNEQYSPITFNPNILQLTINGLYKDLHCMIETMTFTIDDNTPWATQNNLDGAVAGETKPYPTVINVSLSLKIIEHPSVKKENGANTFEYEKSKKYTNYFTGYNEKTVAYGEMPFGGGNLNINYNTNNTSNTFKS